MAYVNFNEEFSAEVVEVNELVNVDLGENGAIIGVEFFSLEDLNLSRQVLDALAHINRPDIIQVVLEAQDLLRQKLTEERR